jgi:hypothetical protein
MVWARHAERIVKMRNAHKDLVGRREDKCLGVDERIILK